MRWLVGLGLLILLAAGTHAARAEDSVVLTVAPAGAPEIDLTLDELKAIGATRLETATPWTEGPQSFTGVTGKQLLAALRARGVTAPFTRLSAVANNDYSIVFPIAEFDQDALLIAYLRNGAELPVRDKGRLWIVFPFDRDAKYRSNTYKSYSIWGLARLELQGD